MSHAWLRPGKPVQIGVTICCLSAFVLFGYEQGVFGPILENKDWQTQFDHPSDSQTGIIVSCYNLGCLVGCCREPRHSNKRLNSESCPLIHASSQLYYRRETRQKTHDLVRHGVGHCRHRPANIGLYSGASRRGTHHYWCRHRHEDIHSANVSSRSQSLPMKSPSHMYFCFRYQSELCSATSRGRLVSAEVLFVGVSHNNLSRSTSPGLCYNYLILY